VSNNRKSYPKKDLTGEKIGMLLPVEWIRGGFWKCICDCGNETVVDTRNLVSGHTRSCGCKVRETKNVKDMTGYEDENLIVISRATNIGETAAWKCICKHCGNEFATKVSNIRFGLTQSCGCQHSRNEQKITRMLIEHNVEFKTQYTFPDLRGIGGRPLRFDFAIFENGRLKKLIEYHGKQHFGKPDGRWSTRYYELVDSDIRKQEYCRRNKIELLVIPFDRPYSINDILK
jgi:hypothetical protein